MADGTAGGGGLLRAAGAGWGKREDVVIVGEIPNTGWPGVAVAGGLKSAAPSGRLHM